MRWRAEIDSGGTFTDVVRLGEGSSRVITVKRLAAVVLARAAASVLGGSA